MRGPICPGKNRISHKLQKSRQGGALVKLEYRERKKERPIKAKLIWTGDRPLILGGFLWLYYNRAMKFLHFWNQIQMSLDAVQVRK